MSRLKVNYTTVGLLLSVNSVLLVYWLENITLAMPVSLASTCEANQMFVLNLLDLQNILLKRDSINNKLIKVHG